MGARLDELPDIGLVFFVVDVVVGARVVVGMTGTKLSTLAAVVLATWELILELHYASLL